MSSPDGMAPGDDVVAENPEAAASPYDILRQRREQKAREVTRDLDIPGYDGMLVCRYRMLDFDRVRKIGLRQQANNANPRAALNSHLDMMVEACEGFFVRNGDGELQPLDPEMPVKYDKRLAMIMGITEAMNARMIAHQLLVHDMHVVGHAGDLMSWMQGEQGAVDEELLGESEGPQT